MFAALITTPLLQNFAVVDCAAKPTFLGLVPWYQYLTVTGVPVQQTDGTVTTVCQIQSFNALGSGSSFLLIGLAIVDDLIRVAALVAVGYVIYGGIQYVTSQGSPDSTKKAQQTIINALIGLALAILAAAIVTFIGNKLGGLN